MKNSLIVLSGIILLYACNTKQEHAAVAHKQIVAEETTKLAPEYQKIENQSITGDFDGDGKLDTLYQHTVSGYNKLPIDSFQTDPWDSIESILLKADAEILLTLSHNHYDTLSLGFGGGLYSLINIGDNNNDQIDEIALVVNTYNFSNISVCEIFTLCKDKWIPLKEFQIHEQAYYDTDLDPKKIKGFLEYQNGDWFYIDYIDLFNAESAKDTLLKPLKINKGC